MAVNKSVVAALLTVLTVVVACSVLKKDNDEDVQLFLTEFENTLASSDEIILTAFQTAQPRETLLQAIRVLQNKESDKVECKAAFGVPTINRQKEFIEVRISVTLSSEQEENVTTEQAVLTMNLVPSQGSYVITKFDAEQLYQAFTYVKNAGQWSAEQQAELAKRVPYYQRAFELQADVDTVFWYASYKGQQYYYGAVGSWLNYFMDGQNGETAEPRIGLLDSTGNVVIPMEYDLIGTIAFEVPNMVEVKVDGYYGYYDISKKIQVVEPRYDMIIPIQKDGVWGIVKTDSVFGWFTEDFQYHDGFPSAEVEKWIREYKYLSKEVVLKDGNQVFCEIPEKSFAGYGIIMPPSYLVKHNLFEEIVGGVNTTNVPMNGWTDYFGIQESLMQTVNDKFNAIVTVIEERYLGGREEFYGESKVVFMSPQHDLIAITHIPTDQEIEITAIDDNLIQIKANATGRWIDTPGEERDLPEYSYFQIHSGYNLKPLTSERKYTFTEFVKIDSSYLAGPFKRYTGYDDETETATYEELVFLSKATVEEIRNEILASYGYEFPDQTTRDRFDEDWYNPRFTDISQFEDQLTEVDRHNLDFLARVIAEMDKSAV
jgi:hypothetical protein